MCPRCQGPLIIKNRARLVFAGGALVTPVILLWFIRPPVWSWLPALLSAVTGVYLIAWGVLARGAWCRHCKSPAFRPHRSS